MSFVRPRRRLRDDMLQMMLAFGCIAAVAAVFPYDGFRAATGPAKERPSAGADGAFVTVSPQVEDIVIAGARTTRTFSNSGFGHVSLYCENLPEMNGRPVMGETMRPEAVWLGGLERYRMNLMPPTLSADPPGAIEVCDDVQKVTFSREELLKLK